MKTLGLSGSVVLLSLGLASAQAPQAPPPTVQPTPTAPPILTATNRLQRIFGPTAVYDGVLPDIKKRGGIDLDLRAPVVPGKEFQNISVNPGTGQAQGVLLFAIRF